MALYGYTMLELARQKKINNRIKREVVYRFEKHNDLTAFIQNVHKQGNFCSLIPADKLRPISQFVNGCILTDGTNDVSTSMISHTNTTVACAGKDAYSGTNTKRGSYNTTESGIITSPNGYKGIRNVWDWSTSQGNGTIGSVGLTRHQLAISEALTSAIPSAGVEIADVLYNYGDLNSNLKIIGNLHIIDYEKEVGYRVTYSGGVISIAEYQLATKQNHLLTRPFLFDSSDASYMPEYVDTHTISQTVANYDGRTSSISYTGDKIIIVTWSGSNIKAYPINTSDWSMGTVVEKTFNGVSFLNQEASPVPCNKDIVLLSGNYAWILATVSGSVEMLKIDLLGNTVDVDEYPLPSAYFDPNGATRNNGCCMLMPNGDFYKFPSIGAISSMQCLYYHNDTFYIGRLPSSFNKDNWQDSMAGANMNAYGTAVMCFGNGIDNSGSLMINAMHGMLSTVNNLDSAVTKSADLTMKLTYELTETSN